jgi:hypothetical protein
VNDVTLFESYVTYGRRKHNTFEINFKINVMSLLTILLILIIAGILLWLVNTYIPMDSKIKTILNVVVVVVVIVWVLKVFGIFNYLKDFHV